MDDKHIIEYIRKHAARINIKDFNFLYLNLKPDDRVDLTKFFIDAKVNPLNYLKYVPFKYAKNANYLKEIIIPKNITIIDEEAFDTCFNLESVYIQNGVTLINDYAFHNCINLENIVFGNRLEQISDYVFVNCGKIKSLKLPKTLKSIGKSTFFSCSSLTNIYYDGTIEEWKNIKINSNNSILFTCTIHCIDGEYKYDY